MKKIVSLTFASTILFGAIFGADMDDKAFSKMTDKITAAYNKFPKNPLKDSYKPEGWYSALKEVEKYTDTAKQKSAQSNKEMAGSSTNEILNYFLKSSGEMFVKIDTLRELSKKKITIEDKDLQSLKELYKKLTTDKSNILAFYINTKVGKVLELIRRDLIDMIEKTVAQVQQQK